MTNKHTFLRIGRIAVVVLAAVFVLNLLAPAGVASAQGWAGVVVGANTVNVRSGPSLNFGPVGQVTVGQSVALLGRTADSVWLLIQMPNGIQGWIDALYIYSPAPITNLPIAFGVQQPPQAPVSTATAYVTGSYRLNVRSGPGATFAVIGRLSLNDSMTVIGRVQDSSWVQVVLPGNVVGWVSTRYVTVNVRLSTLPITFSGTVPPPPLVEPITQPQYQPQPQPQPAYRTHVVAAGENLFRIALRYGVSVQALAAANGIYNYNLIYVGQVLYIP